MLRKTLTTRASPALFTRTAVRLGGGELKIFKEKVLLYTKLKKNIQTFKNVTMAKYLKAQERLNNRDASLGVTAKIFSDPAFNKPYKPGENVAHLVITTNRGTCGSLNARQVQHIGDLVSSSYAPKAIIVGKKGQDSFPSLVPQTIASGLVIETDHNVVNADIASRLLLDTQASRYRILYTRFITVARQDWSNMTIPSFEMFVDRIRGAQTAGDITYQSYVTEDGKATLINNARLYAALNSLSDEALKEFYDFHVMLAVNYAMEENVVSEFAARVVAVENQLQNISKLRDWAQNMYNKTRQTNITAELLELTSAAAAMEEAMNEEAKAKRATGSAVLSAAEREYWSNVLEDDIHALRMEIASGEGKQDTSAATSQVEELTQWRNLLADDEEKPRLTSKAELKEFLEGFATLYAERAFNRRFAEELKAVPKPAVAAAN